MRATTVSVDGQTTSRDSSQYKLSDNSKSMTIISSEEAVCTQTGLHRQQLQKQYWIKSVNNRRNRSSSSSSFSCCCCSCSAEISIKRTLCVPFPCAIVSSCSFSYSGGGGASDLESLQINSSTSSGFIPGPMPFAPVVSGNIIIRSSMCCARRPSVNFNIFLFGRLSKLRYCE